MIEGLYGTLTQEEPGRALDLACGSGRHSLWLDLHSWCVTAVDRSPGAMPASIDVRFADLEKHEFVIEATAWDLIVCWLYWQADLLPEICAGVRPGGLAALSGKTAGRFATSVGNYRAGLPGWIEISSGETDGVAWFIARKPLS